MLLDKTALKATIKIILKFLLFFLIIGYLFSFIISLTTQQNINQNYIDTGKMPPNGPTATVIEARYLSYILMLPFFIASVFPFYIKYFLYLVIILIPIILSVLIYKKQCKKTIWK